MLLPNVNFGSIVRLIMSIEIACYSPEEAESSGIEFTGQHLADDESDINGPPLLTSDKIIAWMRARKMAAGNYIAACDVSVQDPDCGRIWASRDRLFVITETPDTSA